ncbi:MAG: hypothetical protein ACRD3C_12330 [Vicinamibacterales bacterium]
MDHRDDKDRSSEGIIRTAEKPLGRGLEEISHLFLSQRTGNTAASGSSPAPSQRPAATPYAGAPQSAQLRHVHVLKPRTVTKSELAGMLKELEGELEEGLRGIDAGVPCHACGEIDLVAVDRAGRLTIIDFDTTANDGLLLRGMSHFQWIMDNLPTLRRMYPAQQIDWPARPRLFLVAPQFSPLLRRVARLIAWPHIDWVRYRVAEDASGGTAIFFERGLNG